MIVNLYRDPYSPPWRGLRGLRSIRTSTVTDGARGRQYSTCLSQAESMWAAAGHVPTIASPILRYYAILQAAWAVIAASNLPNSEWQPRASHGVEVTVAPSARLLDLAHVTVAPMPTGAAVTLATALDSPLLAQPASLKDLVAALPNQSLIGTLDGAATALTVDVNGADWEVMLLGVGPHLEGDKLLAIKALMQRYPSLSRLPEPTRASTECYPSADFRATFSWERDSPVRIIRDLDAFVDLRDVDRAGRGVVLPAVGGNADVQHPLLTWFLVLHAFSILARYYPARWQPLLNIDSNVDAVLLEKLIDVDSADAIKLVEQAIGAFVRTPGDSADSTDA